eukprot:Phypoly_transcript_07925.p1 GENE.Phypoly_transcript_07925~~Phypoly_transcript_07925.p1  ORF type:complete len:248 (+),score=17.27 Phypoly_transcript_07925:821-1564(+)
MERIRDCPKYTWSEEIGNDIKSLWSDQGIRDAHGLRDPYNNVHHNAAYFFDNIDRLLQSLYVPTEEDILHLRLRHNGIQEIEVKFDDIGFKLLDIGMQRSERRKFIHCFATVTGIIFCANISEYDQTLREDGRCNRLKESLLLFDEICNSVWFRSTPIFLLFTKTEKFYDKIQRVDLSSCFSNYTGGCNFENASAYVKYKFLEQNKSEGRHIYAHFMSKFSTENVEFIFKCIRDVVLKSILSDVIKY